MGDPTLPIRDLVIENTRQIAELQRELATKAERSRLHELTGEMTAALGAVQTVAMLAEQVGGLRKTARDVERKVDHLDDTLVERIDTRVSQRAAKSWTTAQRLAVLTLAVLQVGTILVALAAALTR